MTNEMSVGQVQRALHAAAEQIEVTTPTEQPVLTLSRRRQLQSHRTHTRRWLVPAAAAAAVVIVLATGVIAWHQNQKVATATQVSISNDIADIGGVRFPVPAGWEAAVTNSSTEAVHVCVAVRPGADCDGIQMDIAVPGWFGRTDILPSGTLPMFDQCPPGGTTGRIIMTDDHNPIEVAGRPGIHFWAYCADASQTSHLWQLNDLSLLIYSPPGRYATEISAIVIGLDLSRWAHHQGPVAASVTSGSSAPPTS